MKMPFSKLKHDVLLKISANVIMLVHLVVTALVFLGTIYLFFNPHYALYHLLVVSTVLLTGLFFGFCPLTHMEEQLRRRVNPDFSHRGSFVATYLHKFFRINVRTKTINRFLVFFYIVVYIFIAVFLAR